jgi:uncharacterized protein (TIGR02246 family)
MDVERRWGDEDSTGSRGLTVVLLSSIRPGLAQDDSGGKPDRSAIERDRSAIESLIEMTEAANNAGDVDAWVALFADDAVYMPPGAPAVTTREDLIEIAEAGFRHQADVDIEPIEITVQGDWAFARSRATGSVTLDGSGEVVEVDVKQIVIYSREADGTWRIARMIMNSNR